MRAVAATALSTRQGRRMGGRVAGLFRKRIGLPPMLARTPLAFLGCMGRMHPWRYVVSQQQLVSLEELGSALALNIAWCAPMCVRHSFIREAAGGRSAMLGEFLKFLLISPSGMSTAWGSAGARKVRVPRSLQVYIGVCRAGAACAQRCSGMARAGPTTMYTKMLSAWVGRRHSTLWRRYPTRWRRVPTMVALITSRSRARSHGAFALDQRLNSELQLSLVWRRRACMRRVASRATRWKTCRQGLASKRQQRRCQRTLGCGRTCVRRKWSARTGPTHT